MAQNQRGPHSALSSIQTDPIIVEDQESLASMLSKESSQIHPHPSNPTHLSPFLAGARLESVRWILKINTHHSFSAATAVLAVNYFDRLLLTTPLFQSEKRPWPIHLAAVACLSLAAKMEETHFPTLSQFQVEGITNNVFEAKTIQRMEILVLSKLQWKMNPVTPVSFLFYIAKRLESDGEFHNFFSGQFVRRCEALLLSSVSDCRFMGYLPSIQAASVATLVITGVTDQSLVAGDYQDHIFSILGIQKGQIEDCCKMIVEAVVSRSCFCGEVELHLLPGSPNGVTDASFSSNGSDVDLVDTQSQPGAAEEEEEGQKLRF